MDQVRNVCQTSIVQDAWRRGQVAWPVTKATQVFRDAPVDTFLEIREAEPTSAVKTPRRVTFAAASGTHRH